MIGYSSICAAATTTYLDFGFRDHCRLHNANKSNNNNKLLEETKLL